MPKFPRFSASQLLRFRIRQLWETKGSKMDFEEFYQLKMEKITNSINQEIFDFTQGREHIATVSMSPMIEKINEVFGIEETF